MSVPDVTTAEGSPQPPANATTRRRPPLFRAPRWPPQCPGAARPESVSCYTVTRLRFSGIFRRAPTLSRLRPSPRLFARKCAPDRSRIVRQNSRTPVRLRRLHLKFQVVKYQNGPCRPPVAQPSARVRRCCRGHRAASPHAGARRDSDARSARFALIANASPRSERPAQLPGGAKPVNPQ